MFVVNEKNFPSLILILFLAHICFLHSMFMEPPHQSLHEVKISDDDSSSKCITGRFDMILCRKNNGGRPEFQIKNEGEFQKAFLYSLSELVIVCILKWKQPITELLAFSEFVTRTNSPIVLFYGSRNTFRPFIYFKYHDVMFTTPTSITYHDGGQLHIFGLLLMQTIFSLNNYRCNSDLQSYLYLYHIPQVHPVVGVQVQV